jgi:formylglycine-generating enzyme required for sulfatase activity
MSILGCRVSVRWWIVGLVCVVLVLRATHDSPLQGFAVTAQDEPPPVERVEVPAGCFVMGSDDGYPDEAPAHEICFDEPFWIDRYEVSNAQFVAYSGAAEQPSLTEGDDLPRTNIMWVEASRYCEMRGGRLPTEAEWEYAARGPDSLTYPWGDDFDGELANHCDENCGWGWADDTADDGYSEAAPVTAFEDGASWVGALNMSGNVWEWTFSRYQQDEFPYPYDASDGREVADPGNVPRVVRGGAWDDTSDGLRSSIRAGFFAFYDTHAWIGFRCVQDTAPDGP